MVKRVAFLFLVLLGLSGCVASQDEIQTLKIKVINLETSLVRQQETYQQLNDRLNEIDRKLTNLEKRLDKEVILNLKTQFLSELEELKIAQTRLAHQVEDLLSAKEDINKTFFKRLENIETRINALELKIKGPEEKASNETSQAYSKPSGNETMTDNVTQVARASLPQQPKPISETDLYNQAFDLYKKKNFDQALALFREYVQKYPKGNFTTQSYYWMGEIYFSKKNYEDAILSFQKVIEGPAHPNLKASAMFKQALSFKALGDKDAYTILLRRIIKLFPNTKEANEARALLKKKS